MYCEECGEYAAESRPAKGPRVRAAVHPKCYKALRAKYEALVNDNQALIRKLEGEKDG